MNRYTDNPIYKINKNFKEGRQTEVVYLEKQETITTTSSPVFYIVPSALMIVTIVILICKEYKKTCGGW